MSNILLHSFKKRKEFHYTHALLPGSSCDQLSLVVKCWPETYLDGKSALRSGIVITECTVRKQCERLREILEGYRHTPKFFMNNLQRNKKIKEKMEQLSD